MLVISFTCVALSGESTAAGADVATKCCRFRSRSLDRCGPVISKKEKCSLIIIK